MVVTEALENYLRIIYKLQMKKDIVRVKDIASAMKVRTASVVEAIERLKEKKFVKHEKYGYIKLTQEGILQAHKVYERHQVIFRFLTELLSFDLEEAEKFSCGIEHHLNDQLVNKLEKLVDYFFENPNRLKEFKAFISKEVEMVTLDKIAPGDSAKVIKVIGKPQIKKRLLNMGILPGTHIKIERIAPLGDPVEIRVKDFRLSLRKEEARSIVVERD